MGKRPIVAAAILIGVLAILAAPQFFSTPDEGAGDEADSDIGEAEQSAEAADVQDEESNPASSERSPEGEMVVRDVLSAADPSNEQAHTIRSRLAPLTGAANESVEPLETPAPTTLYQATLAHPASTQADLLYVESLQPLPQDLDQALARIVLAHGAATELLDEPTPPGASLTSAVTMAQALDTAMPTLESYIDHPVWDPPQPREDREVTPIEAPPLDDALVDLYASMGYGPDALSVLEKEAALASEGLAPEEARALARLVAAQAKVQRASAEALSFLAAPASHTDETGQSPGAVDEQLDQSPFDELTIATQQLEAAAEAADEALHQLPADHAARDEPWVDPLGVIVLGTRGNDTFDSRYGADPLVEGAAGDPADAARANVGEASVNSSAVDERGGEVATADVAVDVANQSTIPDPGWHMLVLDPGGDDVYRNNAGGIDAGSVLVRATFDARDSVENTQALLVEDGTACAPGAGICEPATPPGFPSIGTLLTLIQAQGPAVEPGRVPVGLPLTATVVDVDGHDTYEDTGPVIQGAARGLGVGLLYDGDGDDLYNATEMAQGASESYGIGLLLDQDGNDTYDAERRAQGWVDMPDPRAEVPFTTVFAGTAQAEFKLARTAEGSLIDNGGNDVYNITGPISGQGIIQIEDGFARRLVNVFGYPVERTTAKLIDVGGEQQLPVPEVTVNRQTVKMQPSRVNASGEEPAHFWLTRRTPDSPFSSFNVFSPNSARFKTAIHVQPNATPELVGEDTVEAGGLGVDCREGGNGQFGPQQDNFAEEFACFIEILQSPQLLLFGEPERVDDPPALTLTFGGDTHYNGTIAATDPLSQTSASAPTNLGVYTPRIVTDLEGDDTYTGGNETIAFVRNVGNAMVIDRAGEDEMVAGHRSVAYVDTPNPNGVREGVAAVLDLDGDLAVESGNRSQAHAAQRWNQPQFTGPSPLVSPMNAVPPMALLDAGARTPDVGSSGPATSNLVGEGMTLKAGNQSQAYSEGIGLAVLVGSQGSDRYEADGWGQGVHAEQQSAARFCNSALEGSVPLAHGALAGVDPWIGGLGLLLDPDGDDTYRVEGGVGMGDGVMDSSSCAGERVLDFRGSRNVNVLGLGSLVDTRGDDDYHLTETPPRPSEFPERSCSGPDRLDCPEDDRAWVAIDAEPLVKSSDTGTVRLPGSTGIGLDNVRNAHHAAMATCRNFEPLKPGDLHDIEEVEVNRSVDLGELLPEDFEGFTDNPPRDQIPPGEPGSAPELARQAAIEVWNDPVFVVNITIDIVEGNADPGDHRETAAGVLTIAFETVEDEFDPSGTPLWGDVKKNTTEREWYEEIKTAGQENASGTWQGFRNETLLLGPLVDPTLEEINNAVQPVVSEAESIQEDLNVQVDPATAEFLLALQCEETLDTLWDATLEGPVQNAPVDRTPRLEESLPLDDASSGPAAAASTDPAEGALDDLPSPLDDVPVPEGPGSLFLEDAAQRQCREPDGDENADRSGDITDAERPDVACLSITRDVNLGQWLTNDPAADRLDPGDTIACNCSVNLQIEADQGSSRFVSLEDQGLYPSQAFFTTSTTQTGEWYEAFNRFRIPITAEDPIQEREGRESVSPFFVKSEAADFPVNLSALPTGLAQVEVTAIVEDAVSEETGGIVPEETREWTRTLVHERSFEQAHLANVDGETHLFLTAPGPVSAATQPTISLNETDAALTDDLTDEDWVKTGQTSFTLSRLPSSSPIDAPSHTPVAAHEGTPACAALLLELRSDAEGACWTGDSFVVGLPLGEVPTDELTNVRVGEDSLPTDPLALSDSDAEPRLRIGSEDDHSLDVDTVTTGTGSERFTFDENTTVYDVQERGITAITVSNATTTFTRGEDFRTISTRGDAFHDAIQWTATGDRPEDGANFTVEYDWHDGPASLDVHGLPGTRVVDDGREIVEALTDERPDDDWTWITLDPHEDDAIGLYPLTPHLDLTTSDHDHGELHALAGEGERDHAHVELWTPPENEHDEPVALEGELTFDERTQRHVLSCVSLNFADPRDVQNLLADDVSSDREDLEKRPCVTLADGNELSYLLPLGELPGDTGTQLVRTNVTLLQADGGSETSELVGHVDRRGVQGEIVLEPSASRDPQTSVGLQMHVQTSQTPRLDSGDSDLLSVGLEARGPNSSWEELGNVWDRLPEPTDAFVATDYNFSDHLDEEAKASRIEVRGVLQDESNNTLRTSPRPFVVDQQPPNVTETRVVSAEETNLLVLTVDEAISQIRCAQPECSLDVTQTIPGAEPEPFLDDSRARIDARTVTLPIIDLTHGPTYTVELTLEDTLGNQATHEVAVETFSPLSVDASPMENALLSGTVTLNWTTETIDARTLSTFTSAYLVLPEGSCSILQSVPGVVPAREPQRNEKGPLSVQEEAADRSCTVPDGGVDASLILYALAPNEDLLAVDEVPVHLDLNPPSVNATAPGGWVNETARVDVSTTDDLATELEVFVDGQPHPVDGEETTITVSEEGVHEVLARATDEAGNVGVNRTEVRIDRTSPSVTGEVLGVRGGLALVNVTATDEPSGVRDVQLYTGSASGPLVPDVEGESLLLSVPVKANEDELGLRAHDEASNARDLRLSIADVPRVSSGPQVSELRLDTPTPNSLHVSFETANLTTPVLILDVGPRHIEKGLEPGHEHEFTARNVPPGHEAHLTIALPDGGDLLPVVNATSTMPGDNQPPTEIGDIQAEPIEGGVHLSWGDASDDVGIRETVIQRNGREVARTSANAYTDRPQTFQKHAYEIAAIDQAGNRGPWTDVQAEPIPAFTITAVETSPDALTPDEPVRVQATLQTPAGLEPDVVLLEVADQRLPMQRTDNGPYTSTYEVHTRLPTMTMADADAELVVHAIAGDRSDVESFPAPLVATVGPSGDRETDAVPGPGALAALAILGIVALAHRRWSN